MLKALRKRKRAVAKAAQQAFLDAAAKRAKKSHEWNLAYSAQKDREALGAPHCGVYEDGLCVPSNPLTGFVGDVVQPGDPSFYKAHPYNKAFGPPPKIPHLKSFSDASVEAAKTAAREKRDSEAAKAATPAGCVQLPFSSFWFARTYF